MLPVRAGAGGSLKAALIVNVLEDLFFSKGFGLGIEVSDPKRSGRLASPVIWELGGTFPLLERETTAKDMVSALKYIEARIKKSEHAPNSSSVEEGVAFAGQCWMSGSWQAARSGGQSCTRLDAGHPLSSCS